MKQSQFMSAKARRMAYHIGNGRSHKDAAIIARYTNPLRVLPPNMRILHLAKLHTAVRLITESLDLPWSPMAHAALESSYTKLENAASTGLSDYDKMNIGVLMYLVDRAAVQYGFIIPQSRHTTATLMFRNCEDYLLSFLNRLQVDFDGRKKRNGNDE